MTDAPLPIDWRGRSKGSSQRPWPDVRQAAARPAARQAARTESSAAPYGYAALETGASTIVSSARRLAASSSVAAAVDSEVRSTWVVPCAPISTPASCSRRTSAALRMAAPGASGCMPPSHPVTTKTVAGAAWRSRIGASAVQLSARPSSKVSAAAPAPSPSRTRRASPAKVTSS